MKTTCSKLRAFLIAVLVKKGMYAFEAEMAADRLLEADRLGKVAEGCASLPSHVESFDTGDVDPRAVSLQKTDFSAISFFDAGEGLGHVAATKGIELAIKKAKDAGIGLVLVSNSQRLGSPLVYARLAALESMIGVCVTSTGGVSHVEAFGSDRPIFGKQPFAYALPYEENTIGFEFAFEEGESKEIIIPAELSGPLGLLHATLTCGLTGQKMPSEKTRGPALERSEHFLMAINPDSFAGAEALQKKLQQLGAHISGHGDAEDCRDLISNESDEYCPETVNALQELASKLKIEWPFE